MFGYLNMPFKKYIEFRMLTLLHKIISTKEPPFLYNKIQFSQSERTKNITPKFYTSLNSHRQFFIFAVRQWNKLQIDLKKINSSTQFKSKLRHSFSF